MPCSPRAEGDQRQKQAEQVRMFWTEGAGVNGLGSNMSACIARRRHLKDLRHGLACWASAVRQSADVAAVPSSRGADEVARPAAASRASRGRAGGGRLLAVWGTGPTSARCRRGLRSTCCCDSSQRPGDAS
eukprot:753622-Hanusia_phi.AAC.1